MYKKSPRHNPSDSLVLLCPHAALPRYRLSFGASLPILPRFGLSKHKTRCNPGCYNRGSSFSIASEMKGAGGLFCAATWRCSHFKQAGSTCKHASSFTPTPRCCSTFICGPYLPECCVANGNRPGAWLNSAPPVALHQNKTNPFINA